MTEKVTDTQAPMDRIRADDIVDRIGSFVAAGIRVTRICAECESGINTAQLEKLLSEMRLPGGTQFGDWFAGRAEPHLLALEKWADEEEASGQLNLDEYAKTETFERVYGTLFAAHKVRSLVAITATYGIGKTFAARRYARDNPRRANEPGAVWFEFGPGTKGDTGVLDAILGALEPYSSPSGNVSSKLDRILTVLKPGDFLIADECGIPTEKGTGLRFMSYIHEQAGIPVAMIGNPSFHAAVWGKRSDYDALASRTKHISLDGNSDSDVDAWMDFKGITGRNLKKVVLLVVGQPGRDGGLRGAETVLSELRARGLEVTAENFLETAKLFGRMG